MLNRGHGLIEGTLCDFGEFCEVRSRSVHDRRLMLELFLAFSCSKSLALRLFSIGIVAELLLNQSRG